MITSIIALILIVGVLAGPVMSNVEKPGHKVLFKLNKILRSGSMSL